MFKSQYYVHPDIVNQYLEKLSVQETIPCENDFECFEDAVILPLRINLNLFRPELGIHIQGGVFSKELKPLAAYQASRKFDSSVYTPGFRVDHLSFDPIEEIKESNESVIWAGHIMDHFGHFITDSFTRLWYTVKYSSDQRKIAFIIYRNVVSDQDKTFDTLRPYQIELLELLGINTDRIIIVEKPIKFKKVVVPKQSVYWEDTYNRELSKLVYDTLRGTVVPKTHKKIYLSRSKFDNCMFNEVYFESFFAKQGFKVIYPEQLSVQEQISYLAGADEVAATVGTLTHQVLFAKDDVKLIGLLRTHRSLLLKQGVINKIRNVDCVYIDVSINLFPVPAHWEMAFLIGPNYYWNEFLKNEYGIENDTNVFDFLNKNNVLLGDYINIYIKYLLKYKQNLIKYNKTNTNEDYFKSLLISFDSYNKYYEELGSALLAKNINNISIFNNKLFNLKSNSESHEIVIKLDQSRIVFTLSGNRYSIYKYWILYVDSLYLLNLKQECIAKFDLTAQEQNLQKDSAFIGQSMKKKEVYYTLSPLQDIDYQKIIKNFQLKYNAIRLLIKYLVNKKRYKKFKRDPYKFFEDSKNGFIKFLGRYFNSDV